MHWFHIFYSVTTTFFPRANGMGCKKNNYSHSHPVL
jgi:hypothetical protein